MCVTDVQKITVTLSDVTQQHFTGAARYVSKRQHANRRYHRGIERQVVRMSAKRRTVIRIYDEAGNVIVTNEHGCRIAYIQPISRIPKRLEVRRPLREVWLRVSAQSAF